jgi:hypothetical protein
MPLDVFRWTLLDAEYGPAHVAFENATSGLWQATRAAAGVMQHARFGAPYEVMAMHVKQVVDPALQSLNLLRWGQKAGHWAGIDGSEASVLRITAPVYEYMMANRARVGLVEALYVNALRVVPPNCNVNTWQLWSDSFSVVYKAVGTCCAGTLLGMMW